MAVFKKHKMYKGSRTVIAKTKKEHLDYKAKGYTHTKPKAKKKAVKKATPKKLKKGGKSKPLHDACYHSVKARYKVFPSAYASGAIAKCRKRKAGKKK